MMHSHRCSRRTMLTAMGGAIAAVALSPLSARAADSGVITRKIPSTGERLAVIGMGTWRTFNVGRDPKLRDQRVEVMKAFFAGGGQMIDSSPMYGTSPDVIGYGLKKLDRPDRLFSAEKVWTRDGSETRSQIAQSEKAWNVPRFDLMQVHNLLAWEEHLETLQRLKEAKEIRYVGITTSHGRRHDDFERIMKSHDLDFVQLTYNIENREVERRLLPLAHERGIAVIANRPFGGGSIIDRYKKRPLPKWAGEIDCANWAQFLLKFVVSHPHVTCAIPATTRVDHMRENMGAAKGRLPDAKTRKRMLAYIGSL